MSNFSDFLKMSSVKSSKNDDSFKNFCGDYLKLVKDIRGSNLLTDKINIINGKRETCEIVFNLPCDIKIIYKDPEGDYTDFSSTIINKKLMDMATKFNFPAKVKKNLNFNNISNNEGMEFSYKENDYDINVVIKIYNDYNLTDANLQFVFVIEGGKSNTVDENFSNKLKIGTILYTHNRNTVEFYEIVNRSDSKIFFQRIGEKIVCSRGVEKRIANSRDREKKIYTGTMISSSNISFNKKTLSVWNGVPVSITD